MLISLGFWVSIAGVGENRLQRLCQAIARLLPNSQHSFLNTLEWVQNLPPTF
ncbi:hypothetical protein [Nostoc sp. C052]|uniref:hypothetical protein n=1 Tax=Nostoc sp. C052 TaxID=2576902 RepID=UPI0015C37240|nr:hypothetical protein [Nostoc sp. C052]